MGLQLRQARSVPSGCPRQSGVFRLFLHILSRQVCGWSGGGLQD
jgi:hypothetical protein